MSNTNKLSKKEYRVLKILFKDNNRNSPKLNDKYSPEIASLLIYKMLCEVDLGNPTYKYVGFYPNNNGLLYIEQHKNQIKKIVSNIFKTTISITTLIVAILSLYLTYTK